MTDGEGYLYTQLPWNFITKFHEGVVIQKDGILQRTFAYRAPDLDSSGEHEIASLALRVNDFARRLGSGWAFFVEAQRFYTREYPAAAFEYHAGSFSALAPYLIDREREAAFSAWGRHFESSYYLTFVWRPPDDNVKKLTQMFIQSGSKTKNNSVKNIEENVAYFVNETNAVIGIIAQEMILVPLNNSETVSYLHSTVSLKRHPIAFPCTSILLDRILPDEELSTSLTMKLGEHWIPIIGVNDFPSETYPAILDALNRERIEYRWVTRYICMDKEDGKKEAQKREKAHRGSKKTFLQTFAESTSGEPAMATNHGAGVKESDSIAAGVEIDGDEAALGLYTSSIMVYDTSFTLARKKADVVKNTVNSMGFTCKEETFNALEAWKAMMPGQMYANYRALPVMTNTLSHIIPLSSIWPGMRVNEHAGRVSGVDLPHLTCSTSEGTPFFLNLNPTDVGHTAIWGPTGAGKSTLLNLLEMQFFKYPGSQVIVFDKDKSCRQGCLACGGLFYEPAGEAQGAVNFQPLRDLESDGDLLNAIDFIETCLVVSGDFTVTPPMRKAIKEAMELLRDKSKKSSRTITSFVQYCNFTEPGTRRDVIKEQLGDYLIHGGKYGKIFDSSSSEISLDNRFVAIEMGRLMDLQNGCVVPALFYLFNLVDKKFDGSLTMLVLDEAWLFLENELFSRKFSEWLKTLRKKNVFVVFATQEVADVAKSSLKSTILQQCLTKIYLADNQALTEAAFEVYSSFGLTAPEIALLDGARMKRDYYYKSFLGGRKFQLDLGELSLALIGTPDHKMLDAMVKGYEPGSSFCTAILDAKGIAYRKYLGPGAPQENKPQKIAERQAAVTAGAPAPEKAPLAGNRAAGKLPELLEAVGNIPEKKSKNGRAAAAIARQFEISETIVYRARRLLKTGNAELIEKVKSGELSLWKALKAGGGAHAEQKPA